MANIPLRTRGTSVVFTEVSVLPKSKKSAGGFGALTKVLAIKEMLGVFDRAGDLHNTVIQAQVCTKVWMFVTQGNLAANVSLAPSSWAHTCDRYGKARGQEMVL